MSEKADKLEIDCDDIDMHVVSCDEEDIVNFKC